MHEAYQFKLWRLPDVPHCQIGDLCSLAPLLSTMRIVATSPSTRTCRRYIAYCASSFFFMQTPNDREKEALELNQFTVKRTFLLLISKSAPSRIIMKSPRIPWAPHDAIRDDPVCTVCMMGLTCAIVNSSTIDTVCIQSHPHSHLMMGLTTMTKNSVWFNQFILIWSRARSAGI